MPEQTPQTDTAYRAEAARADGPGDPTAGDAGPDLDDDGLPTEAMPAVPDETGPVPTTQDHATQVATQDQWWLGPSSVPPLVLPSVTPPVSQGVDGDEVPFWLLPAPPRPTAAAGPARATGATPAASAPLGPPRGPGPVLGPPPPAHRETRVVDPPGRGVGATAGPLVRRVGALPQSWLVAAAAAAVGLVVVLVALVALGGDHPAPSAAAAKPSSSAAPLDASLVTASASSVQDAEGRTTYAAANTLDGRLDTAWNSDGKADGRGPGIRLRYRFAEPVELTAVSIANGYQKVVTSGGKNRDLFDANSRIAKVTVTTDGGSWTFALKDAKARQTLRESFGTTTSVTLEIVSVYPGARYTDVGVSEVGFAGVVPG